MKGGRVSYVHNWVGRERYTITAPRAAARRQGDDPLRVRLRGRRSLVRAARERSSSMGSRWPKDGSSRTTPFLFSADETADVGVDEATPVTEAYAERHNEFTGTIETVTVDVN